MADFPEAISSAELASGLLVRGIQINGHYIIVNESSLCPSAEVDQIFYIQGGPRAAIANVGLRYLQGQITIPVRVDRDGALEPAVRSLLDCAENPSAETALRIDTNHILTLDNSNTSSDDYKAVMAEIWATSSNAPLSFDCCLVKSLKLIASDQGVSLEAGIVGVIDKRAEYIAPPATYMLHRQLSWSDCNASRIESAMRNVSQIQITIDNDIKTPTFLMPFDTEANQRTDQPQFLGVQNVKWGGFFEEMLRVGMETDTYIHGGFMQNENLVLEFGPIAAKISVPLFKVSEQPISQIKLLKRKTEFFAQNYPRMNNIKGDLFIYS